VVLPPAQPNFTHPFKVAARARIPLGVLRRIFRNLVMTVAVDSPLATANYPLSSPGSAREVPDGALAVDAELGVAPQTSHSILAQLRLPLCASPT